jgi:hypothetical protein
MEFLEKIKPQTLKDIVSNQKEITSILSLLTLNINVLLIGPHGSGKTIVLNLIKEKYKESFFINQSITIREINEYVNCNKKNKLLIIDDIEIYDKNILAFIKELINKNKIVILISSINNHTIKKIETISLQYPSYEDLKLYFNSHSLHFNDKKLYLKTQGCIRDIILNINSDIIYNDFKNKNNEEIIDVIVNKTFNFKNLNNISNLNEICNIIYENMNIDLQSYGKINKYYIDLNIIETYIFKSLDWTLYNDIQKMKIMSILLIKNKIKSISKNKKNLKTKKDFIYDNSFNSKYELISFANNNIEYNSKYNNFYNKYFK